jgi:hypothetical protein
LNLSQSIKELQHFGINFDVKNQGKIVIFGKFEMSPRCHGKTGDDIKPVIINGQNSLFLITKYKYIISFYYNNIQYISIERLEFINYMQTINLVSKS